MTEPRKRFFRSLRNHIFQNRTLIKTTTAPSIESLTRELDEIDEHHNSGETSENIIKTIKEKPSNSIVPIMP